VLASANGVSTAILTAVKRVDRYALVNKETNQWKVRVYTGKMTRMGQMLSNTEQMMDVFSNSDSKPQKVSQDKNR